MMIEKLLTSIMLTVLALTQTMFAAGGAPSVPWEKWQPLLGTWEAEGGGSPGQGNGTFSFSYDLQKRVIVRKSHS